MVLFFFFCRVAIAGIFAISLIAKIRNSSSLKETLQNTRLVPVKLLNIIVLSLIVGECVVVTSLLLGHSAIWYGFSLAAVLLLIFTIVLLWIMVKKIKTSCSCFGGKKRQVSWRDVYRNLMLVGMAVSGSILANRPDAYLEQFNEDMALPFIMALVFILVLLKADVVIDILKK
jgi:hypothetical protein